MRRSVFIVVALVFAIAVGAIAQEGTVNERGRRVFIAQGCHGCHTVGQIGTPLGPDLTHVGRRLSDDGLRRWLADPAAVRPRAHMPTLELTPTDIETLAAFLAALD